MTKLEHDPLGIVAGRWYHGSGFEWQTGTPDWRDWGARIELEFEGGSTTEGWLYVNEVFYDGEDECPSWAVVSDGMEYISFYDAERWRFVPQPARG